MTAKWARAFPSSPWRSIPTVSSCTGPWSDPAAPNACGCCGFVVAAVSFAVLAVAVAQRSGPLGPDVTALHDVVDWRSGWLTFLAKGLTALGTDVAVYSTLVVGGLLCAWRKERPLAGVLAVAILITGQLVRLGINHAIARPRPPAALRLVHAGGFAFLPVTPPLRPWPTDCSQSCCR